MEPNRQRFHQAQLLDAQGGGVKLVRGHRDVLGQSTISLYAKRFVELAGIRPMAQAGRTFAATGVRRHGDVHARPQSRVLFASLDDGCGHLMAGNAREGHQRIFAAKRIQVAAAKSNHADLQQEIFLGCNRLRNHTYFGFAWLSYDEGFHRCSGVM